MSGTKDRGLLYWNDIAKQLGGYIDIDWAEDATDRHSTSGFMFSLGNAAIPWSSKKQSTMALSSTEAEYRGATVATCKSIWIKQLLQDLQVVVVDSIPIYYDNISYMQLAKNPMVHARMKHICQNQEKR